MHLWVAIRHLAPFSTDEDLGTGILLYGSGHGRLRPGLRAFHALLGGGLLTFEWGGGGLNTLLHSRKCTFKLGARGGLKRARKFGHASTSSPSVDCESLTPTRGATQQSVDCESLTPTQGAMQQSVHCESLTPTRGATQQSVDCESLTPTRGATQQSVDCESLTPTQGATQQSVDCEGERGEKIRSVPQVGTLPTSMHFQ